jgi:outer membrane protein assembly factor BamB
MKLILSLIALLAVNLSVQAQIEFSMKIKNTKNKPMYNVEVTAKNGSVVLVQKTNSSGDVNFTLNEPGMYTFSYLDKPEAATYTVKAGYKGSASRSSTYDPKGVFKVTPKQNREGIAFKTLRATHNQGKPGVAKVVMQIKEMGSSGTPGVSVQIVDFVDKVKYDGVSNGSGKATFYLKINREYEVDVEEIETVQNVKVPDFANGEMRQTVNYKKTIVRETVNNDTIHQKNISQTTGTTRHMLFELNLKDYDGNPSSGEPVFLVAQDGSRTYESMTNDDGYAKFMLQKGTNYVMNLKYEEGVHLVKASETKGFGQAMSTRRYRGSAVIEQMMEDRRLEAKANEKGFVTNFEETPIRKADEPTDYLKPTPKGFNLDFGNSSEMGTPTIADNKLFTQEGFYSANFYALNAADGKYLWGVELGESGISPAVFHNGVLLINTYSCTLYAIDSETGDLLWSKWLAGTIYSTPSADDNSVYAVYDNGGTNPLDNEESYVLASFDLRTGKLNWMNWIDKEVIACPVVEGGEVHVASHSGNYYVFDKKTGERTLESKDIKAVSSPTITATEIFLTVKNGSQENLVVLDRKTLKKKKIYKKDINPTLISENHSSYNDMNFNGSHPIVYKNEVVVVLDKDKIMAFDARTETVLWEKAASTDPAQIPIVADGKVIVGTMDGKVMSYDIRTGTSTVLSTSEESIDSQPISHKGKLYVVSAGVLMVINAVRDFGHNQWNKDSTHNPYWR